MGLCASAEKVVPTYDTDGDGIAFNEQIKIQTNNYRPSCPPVMLPVGFLNMINDAKNHVLINTNDAGGKIIIIGSGFHKAMEFRPILAGVTLDITKKKEEGEGRIVFATIDAICASVLASTSLVIRKDPLAGGDEAALQERLKQYQESFITWIKSMTRDTSTTSITFIRNVYPMEGGEQLKPAWVCGLSVKAALDCGSGKVSLVDGVTGAQCPGYNNNEWNTESAWSPEDIIKNTKICEETCTNNINLDESQGGRLSKEKQILACATGNWRKDHMKDTIPLFRAELLKLNIDFRIMDGLLEGKFGGISALKCAAPYDMTNVHWSVIELGKGSTQICRFTKET